jgi:ankyrin repeat protein
MRLYRIAGLSLALIAVVVAVGLGLSPLKRHLTNAALVEAVRRRDAVAVAVALRRGADPNALNPEAVPVLHWSVTFGDFETTQLLLKGGAQVDSPTRWGETPLRLAAGRVNSRVVALLLDAGASVNHQNEFGNTALMAAVGAEQTANVRLLLSHGAQVHLASTTGNTAVSIARATNNPEIRALIERAAQRQSQARRWSSTAAPVGNTTPQRDGR